MRLRDLVLVVGVTFAVASCSGDDSSTEAGAQPTSMDATTTTEPGSEGCEPARAAESGTVRRQLVHDGLERAYELSIPPDYDGEEPSPLLLDLHGFGSDGAQQNDYTGMPEAAGARGYVVVAPDGGPLSVPSDAPGGDRFDGTPFWNFFGSGEVSFGEGAAPLGLSGDASSLGANDVSFLTALVDELGGVLCIDEARVYATGMSNGAGMSTTLACEVGDRLAAIAPIAGVNLTGRCPGDDPVPVLAIHGDADRVAGYDGNLLLGFELGNPSVPDRMAQWARHNGCAPDPEIDEPFPGVVRSKWPDCDDGADTELWTVTGGGHVWPKVDGDPPAPFDATDVVLDFFDTHTRSER